MRRVLTNHALGAYRRRIHNCASREEVQAELDAGELVQDPPPGAPAPRPFAYDQAGYVVTGRAIFPVVRARDRLVATTALYHRDGR